MTTTRSTPLPPDPPPAADERTTLLAYLDFYRDVFIRKLEGLDDAQGKRAACPPSDLTPLGIGRHLAEVELVWMRRRLGENDVPYLFDNSDDVDIDLHPGPDDTTADAIQMWHEQVAVARANLERFQLDDMLTAEVRGQSMSVRWMIVHMIEEYARHCGHLDLLCEAIDGRTGD